MMEVALLGIRIKIEISRDKKPKRKPDPKPPLPREAVPMTEGRRRKKSS